MPVVLSQRIDTDSEYDDIPFWEYHFPRRYRRQLRTGDRFVYYQGDKSKREHRYYYGHGVIGAINERSEDASFVAKILDGTRLRSSVPIYNPDGGFYESLGYSEVRNSETPPWQQSIRPISVQAFNAILAAASSSGEVLENYAGVEQTHEPLRILEELNARYSGLEPRLRNIRITKHLDRGTAVTNALKKFLGAVCQICDWQGFSKPDGDRYIEAHHLSQISTLQPNSLCTENIILVCPNCHRQLHLAAAIEILDRGDRILIQIADRRTEIRKNSIQYLLQFANHE